MERILIIGSNGAGKSTFSYQLSAKTGLPLIHLDQIYWRNRWEVTPRDEFEQRVYNEVIKPCWIIEGNNLRSLKQRLPYADTIIWFEFPPFVCITNVLKREIKYRNKVRPDMPDECISTLSFDFLKEVWKFNRKNHARIQTLLQEAGSKEVIYFTKYKQVKQYIEKISR